MADDSYLDDDGEGLLTQGDPGGSILGSAPVEPAGPASSPAAVPTTPAAAAGEQAKLRLAPRMAGVRVKGLLAGLAGPAPLAHGSSIPRGCDSYLCRPAQPAGTMAVFRAP